MKKYFIDLLLKKVPSDYNQVSKTFSNSRNKPWAEFDLYSNSCFEGANVLDMGCGNGRLYFSLKSKGVNYIGLDNSVGLLDQAENNLINEDVDLIIGDFTNIPLKDSSLDRIFAVASFHHLPGKDKRLDALNEMQRVLKKDGVLFISVWNLFQPKYLKEVLKSLLRLHKFDFGDTFIKLGGVKRYYHAFTTFEFKSLIKKSNFELVQIHYYKNTKKTESFWDSQNIVFELKIKS